MKKVLLRIIRFPLTRIIIALTIVVVALIAAGVALRSVRTAVVLMHRRPGPAFDLLEAVVMAATAVLAYAGYVKLVERRPVDELDTRGAPAEFGRGALLGAGLFTATIGVLWVLGAYRVAGVNPPVVLLAMLGPSITSGFAEEVITRAIIFRITEDGLGSWAALVLSSLFFGFAHAWNPGATLLSSVAIAVEAGVLLGVAFMLTRRLWFAAGLHFAWNLTQGGVFGVAVSGMKVRGLLAGELAGPELLTGGAFGPEASVVAMAVCPVAAVWLTVRAVRLGHVRPPFWARREPPKPADAPGGAEAIA